MTAKHEPTDEQRKTVRAMSAYGITQDKIAAVIGISDVTLRLYYTHELETAETEANAKVAQSLFNMATKGGNVTAAIFWLKTRAQWKETLRIDGSGENGAIVFQVLTGVPRPDITED